MDSRLIRRILSLVLLGVLGLSLLGCTTSVVPVLPTPTDAAPAPTEPPTPTEPPAPTPTPLPSRVVLVAPPETDAATAGAVETILGELSTEAGLQVETRPVLTASDLTPDLLLVVALPPDPGLAALAAAAPNTRFLSAGIPGVQPAANLSVIGAEGDHPDRQGFLAGYLAAVVTQDWRVGAITLQDTEGGRAAQLGFTNGVVFYCGLCRPAYPPHYPYPITWEIPAGASQAEQQAAVDTMVANAVKTVYVGPGVGDEGLVTALAEAGIQIIGSFPPAQAVREKWVASIYPDLAGALRQAWPGLLSGETGESLDLSFEMPLVIGERNESLFSLGRQRLVEEMLVELLAGYVDTGSGSSAGEGQP